MGIYAQDYKSWFFEFAQNNSRECRENVAHSFKQCFKYSFLLHDLQGVQYINDVGMYLILVYRL